MFRILLVEDDPPTVSQITKAIEEEIPQARVDSATTVQEAVTCLNKYATRPYDAIILDFRLPASTGEHDEVDESVCFEARTLMPDALMVHITAFEDDPQIIHHLKDVHETQFGNKAIRLWKLETKKNIANELLDRLKPELYGQRVMKLLRGLFNLQNSPAAATNLRKRFVRGRRTGRSRTHDLDIVTQAIACYWPSLAEDVKKQIRQIFSVKERGTQVIVSPFRSPFSRISSAASPNSHAKENKNVLTRDMGYH
jgi:CheY-like chemotaxis protein